MNIPVVKPKEQISSDDASEIIIDREPAPSDPFQLQEGVLVDKDGRRVALVKPQTWY